MTKFLNGPVSAFQNILNSLQLQIQDDDEELEYRADDIIKEPSSADIAASSILSLCQHRQLTSGIHSTKTASWKYHEAQSGQTFSRSEGLGVASMNMFEDGFFSSDPTNPHQVDGKQSARY